VTVFFLTGYIQVLIKQPYVLYTQE